MVNKKYPTIKQSGFTRRKTLTLYDDYLTIDSPEMLLGMSTEKMVFYDEIKTVYRYRTIYWEILWLMIPIFIFVIMGIALLSKHDQLSRVFSYAFLGLGVSLSFLIPYIAFNRKKQLLLIVTQKAEKIEIRADKPWLLWWGARRKTFFKNFFNKLGLDILT